MSRARSLIGLLRRRRPSAEEVTLDAVKRALDELIEEGRVERFLGPDGQWRYRAVDPEAPDA